MGSFISRDPLGYVDGTALYPGFFAMKWATDAMGNAIMWSLGKAERVRRVTPPPGARENTGNNTNSMVFSITSNVNSNWVVRVKGKRSSCCKLGAETSLTNLTWWAKPPKREPNPNWTVEQEERWELQQMIDAYNRAKTTVSGYRNYHTNYHPCPVVDAIRDYLVAREQVERAGAYVAIFWRDNVEHPAQHYLTQLATAQAAESQEITAMRAAGRALATALQKFGKCKCTYSPAPVEPGF